MNVELTIEEANSLYEAIEDRLEKLGAVPDTIEGENERDRLMKLRYHISVNISKEREKRT